jgi:hypothetical protein
MDVIKSTILSIFNRNRLRFFWTRSPAIATPFFFAEFLTMYFLPSLQPILRSSEM